MVILCFGLGAFFVYLCNTGTGTLPSQTESQVLKMSVSMGMMEFFQNTGGQVIRSSSFTWVQLGEMFGDTINSKADVTC